MPAPSVPVRRAPPWRFGDADDAHGNRDRNTVTTVVSQPNPENLLSGQQRPDHAGVDARRRYSDRREGGGRLTRQPHQDTDRGAHDQRGGQPPECTGTGSCQMAIVKFIHSSPMCGFGPGAG